MPRLFVAIELPEALKEALAAVVAPWRGERSVRWVRPESVHMTLKFLGDTPDEIVPALVGAVRTTAAAHATLDLALEGFGTFPRRGPPRVLWVGVGGDVEPLRALAGAIDAATVPLGFPSEDRPWSPHLTIGRVKGNARRAVEGLSGLGAVGSFHAAAVVLFRSDLRPDGAIYTAVASGALGSG